MANPFSSLDDYEYSYLTSHIFEADDSDILEQLLATETDDHRNAWFETKAENADIQEFIADIERARVLAQRASSEVAAARAVRRAVLISSAQSVADGLPAPLIVAAVKKKVLALDLGWKLSTSTGDLVNRKAALIGLAPLIDEVIAQKTLEAWTSPPLLAGWADVAAALAPRLRPEVFEAAVTPHFSTLYAAGDVEALVGLAPHLSASCMESLLCTLQDEFWRSGPLSQIVAVIAPYAAEARLQMLLSLLFEDWADHASAEDAWASLAPRLSLDCVDWALEKTRGLDSFDQLSAYRALLPRLVQEGRTEQALQIVEVTEDPDDLRLAVIAALAECGLVEQALATIEALQSHVSRAQAIQKVAPFLEPSQLQSALALALGLALAEARSAAMRALAPKLRGPEQRTVLREALTGTRQIDGIGYDDQKKVVSGALRRGRALAHLVELFLEGRDPPGAREVFSDLSDILEYPRDSAYRDEADRDESRELKEIIAASLGKLLPTIIRVDGFGSAMQMMKRHSDDKLRAITLSHAAPVLSSIDRDNILESAGSVEEIVALAPYLSQHALARILRELRPKMIRDVHGELIGGLAPFLSSTLLGEAISIVRAIDDSLGQAVALASLSALLPERERTLVASEALQAAQSAGPPFDGSRAQALEDIAPHLPGPVLRNAIDVAEAMTLDILVHRTLSALLPALAATGDVDEVWPRLEQLPRALQVETLTSLAPLVPLAVLDRLLRRMSSIRADYPTRELFARLIDNLPDASRARLVEALLMLGDENTRASLLTCIITGMPHTLDREVEAVVLGASSHVVGALALSKLALRTSERRCYLVGEAIKRLRPPFDQVYFPGAAEALAAAAAGSSMWSDFYSAAEQLPDERCRISAMNAAIPHLSNEEMWALLRDTMREPGKVENRPALVIEAAKRGAPDKAMLMYNMLPVWKKAAVIEDLIPYLPSQDIEAVIESFDYDGRSNWARIMFGKLASSVPKSLVGKTLVATLELPDKFDQAEPLRTLVRRVLIELGAEHRPNLEQALLLCSKRHRLDLLYELGSLAPLVTAVGGADAARCSIDAIHDCVRWWR